MAPNYLSVILKTFRSYKSLGEKTLEQVKDAEINFTPNEESNSLALIVKHLHGNMLSRWTDFLNSDGEKENRQRDTEFEGSVTDKKELLRLWEAGWACLFAALEGLREEDLSRTIYIRKEGHTVLEAINRQLAHYSYHIGQLVYLGKMIRSGTWRSLSIPKGKSEQFNAEKFSK
jgi:hypothetical protein